MKQDPSWDTFSDRFKTVVQVLAGGYCEMEIAGSFWDFHEELATVNTMMKKIAPHWLSALEASLIGLRAAVRPRTPTDC